MMGESSGWLIVYLFLFEYCDPVNNAFNLLHLVVLLLINPGVHFFMSFETHIFDSLKFNMSSREHNNKTQQFIISVYVC